MTNRSNNLTSTLTDGSRTGKEKMRDEAFIIAEEMVNDNIKDTFKVLSLPSTAWVFEKQFLNYVSNRKINVVLHAFEYDYELYSKMCKDIFNFKCSDRMPIKQKSHYRVKNMYANSPVIVHNINVLEYLKNTNETFDFMWLDLMSPIDCISPYLKYIEEKTNPNGKVILTFIKGREKAGSNISNRVEYAMSFLQEMELLDTIEYVDTSPIVNIVLKKKLTMQDLEKAIYLGPETQTKTNMNTENILEEKIVEAKPSKSQSLRLSLEKLDGGFISNITGKRRIYQHADEVVDAIDMNKIIGKLEHSEYRLNIDIVHKDDIQDYNDIIEFRKQEALITLEGAKESGLIEEAPKFNPMPKEPVLDMDTPIKVTASTAYTIHRLKSIDWAGLHDQLHMEPLEISRITGMNVTTLYNSLKKVRAGEASFQNTSARIGFTTLAMYYERTLGVRSSTKEQCEKMKDDLLVMIRDLEVMGSGKSHIKVSEVAVKLVKMRSLLM